MAISVSHRTCEALNGGLLRPRRAFSAPAGGPPAPARARDRHPRPPGPGASSSFQAPLLHYVRQFSNRNRVVEFQKCRGGLDFATTKRAKAANMDLRFWRRRGE